jgi:hypothetical protein
VEGVGCVTPTASLPPNLQKKMVLVLREDGDNVVVECTESNMVLMRKPKTKVGFNVHEEVSKLNIEDQTMGCSQMSEKKSNNGVSVSMTEKIERGEAKN